MRIMEHPRSVILTGEIRPRKSLSQSFLTSEFWAEQIAQWATQGRPAEVWEIGPGLGAITRSLVRRTNASITVFEIDPKAIAYLKKQLPSLKIIEGDFLLVDMTAKAGGHGPLHIVSNLPYHISSPVFFKLLGSRSLFARCVLTFQKEFSERLIARPRTKSYGGLSVLAQLCFKIELLGTIPPTLFYPKPGVSSQVVLLEPIPTLPENFDALRLLVRASFAYRRKKLMSNLKKAFPSAPVEGIFEQLGISPMARAEELSKEMFVRLAKKIDSTNAVMASFGLQSPG